MVSAFYSSSGHKPVAKAVHTLNQAGAKWVPINKSFISLIKIILCAATERLGLASAAVTLRCVTHQGYRHLVLVNDDSAIQIAAAGRVEEFIISTDGFLGSSFLDGVPGAMDMDKAITLPVNHLQQRLGYLVAQPLEVDVLRTVRAAAVHQGLQAVSEEIVRTIKRYQTRYRAIYIYGDQYYWIGNSQVLRQLDQRIDRLARVNLPVVIRGDKGTGKIIAARSLHCLRYSDMVPFIESDCREWQESAVQSMLQSLHTYARGGTLFLRNIDKLSVASGQILRNFQEQRRVAVATSGSGDGQLRLLMSLSHRNAQLPAVLAHWLEEQAIDLYLPSLHERREDVHDLAYFFMREQNPAQEFDFTDAARHLLEMLQWDENVDQLKRLVQTLMQASPSPLISLELLEQYLPPQPRFKL
jgi:transcriptional regulator with GAF, ATPase, and Fis domain